MQKLRRPMGSLSDPVRAVFVFYVLCEDRTLCQGRVAAVENALRCESPARQTLCTVNFCGNFCGH